MQRSLHARNLSMPRWLIPMFYVAAAVVCGFVLPRLEHDFLEAYTHAMSVASAQAAMSAIASGMLALTGIVFALAFVMVQFSAMAYSPRLVIWLSNDPTLFHSLGLFIATFVYAIATLGWIDRGGNGKVPLFSVLLGLRGGLADARAGRQAYLYGLLMGGEDRKELLRSGLTAIRDLLCMGIVLDAVAQLLIYRQVHPGAALVIGPVFICLPYAVTRALTNRAIGLLHRGSEGKREER